MEEKPRHSKTQEDFDQAQAEGIYEEGMANMALYHRHCQDPVIFRALGDIREKALLDLACGDGFYTRRFKQECGADQVVGIDLSPKQIEKARAVEEAKPLGIQYFACDASDLDLNYDFDVITAIHLLHYLENREEIAGVLKKVHDLLKENGRFITMVANPEFDLTRHDPEDSKTKFAYYFSAAPEENGATMTFHPGGLEKEREITIGLRRWHRGFLNEIAREQGFEPKWRDPFISPEGLEEYGEAFFENYLPNPQSKLFLLSKLN
ncbi:MAG: methyltransferase domain-containing protein [Acidobacteria bacterium]|nr:MAG: methyltransferase domain-containing protein [Acidobacteriota bacterium]REK02983.1 MAG: methyltransferase domain-containing protein [Acidobacteriota bacterium]REK13213.1 MAG: methyltransferase domain-containing protein [Acidobacteriota bacterium]REK41207.1 MAG: methyltransferase domain-containing protein [Acidobacteriota bacterium]